MTGRPVLPKPRNRSIESADGYVRTATQRGKFLPIAEDAVRNRAVALHFGDSLVGICKPDESIGIDHAGICAVNLPLCQRFCYRSC